MNNKGFSFNDFFYRMGWGILSAACVFAMSRIQALTDSISSLNTNMAVVANQISASKELVQDLSILARDHEKRITVLESKRRN